MKKNNQLIPPRLWTIFQDFVSKNPDFEKKCEELEIKAQSYSQLFHIDAYRRGLLKKEEVIIEIVDKTKQLSIIKYLTEE